MGIANKRSQRNRKEDAPQTQPRRPAEPAQGSRCAEAVARTRTVRRGLDPGRVARGEKRWEVVGRAGQFLRGEQRVVEGVAARPRDVVGDAVRDGDGQVEDGVVVRVVEPEVLADGDLDT